ncbi:hypothetical protein J2S46_007445 [Kitasatospora herbaricolor]|uniref:hypothetical protein n=1 Tax=Kitasatospora herbaricolor TaxID=68217 RepID=UPI00174A81E2|nr:hypothetical protein [Kitasatospora herbaricolor]MDQ0312889.1 hypothetical protein [Kitasatospora herbaricolor]
MTETTRDRSPHAAGASGSPPTPRATAPSGRDEVPAEYRRLSAAYPQDLPCPPGRTLYAVVPGEPGFWEAGTDRIHTRVRHLRPAGGRGGVATAAGMGAPAPAAPVGRHTGNLWP